MFAATIHKQNSVERAHCYIYINSNRQNYIEAAPYKVSSGYYTVSASEVFRLNVGDRFSNGIETEN